MLDYSLSANAQAGVQGHPDWSRREELSRWSSEAARGDRASCGQADPEEVDSSVHTTEVLVDMSYMLRTRSTFIYQQSYRFHTFYPRRIAARHWPSSVWLHRHLHVDQLCRVFVNRKTGLGVPVARGESSLAEDSSLAFERSQDGVHAVPSGGFLRCCGGAGGQKIEDGRVGMTGLVAWQDSDDAPCSSDALVFKHVGQCTLSEVSAAF